MGRTIRPVQKRVLSTNSKDHVLSDEGGKSTCDDAGPGPMKRASKRIINHGLRRL